MHRIASCLALAVFLLPAALAGRDETPVPTANPTDPAKVEFFEKKVRPLLHEKCYSCHSAEAKKLKGKFKLDTREDLLKGGDEGKVIDEKTPSKSGLLAAVKRVDEDKAMPPKEKDKLTDEQVKILEQWVKDGVTYGKAEKPKASAESTGGKPADPKAHWSFVAPKELNASEPAASAAALGWVRTDADRFVLAKLNEKGLAPSKLADKRTLIRRATYDLIGLPPTMNEIAAFENDHSTDAFDKVIDRLLASPHYGERWGRHWLDVARYADSKGYVFEEERRYPFSYTYRDWVIRAFNSDLPYDQFLVHQIAADRLDLKGDDRQHLAALGFLTLGRRFLNNQADIIDDRIDVVTRGTMALTVSCARCHDHKFEPIPTADYYSLYGVFASSREPTELPLINAPDPKEAEAFKKELAAREAEIEKYRKERFDAATAGIRTPQGLSSCLQASLALRGTGDEKRKERRAIFAKFGVNELIVARWAAKLTVAKTQHHPVLAPLLVWSDTPGLSLKSPSQVLAEQMVTGRLLAKPLNGRVAAQLMVVPATSVKDLADRYGTLLAQFDKPEPLPSPDDEVLRQVLRATDAPTNIALSEVDWFLDGAQQAALRGLVQKRDALVATHPGSPPRAMAMEDGPVVEPVIFKRGNPANRGEQVPRQFLEILSSGKREPFKDGSGRLDLARAIASKDNPLTARVMVNRVWMHHFGQGLVRTPSDFGTRGEQPTHPELLDYLAVRFMNDGWSIKQLHRTIMRSAVYQQASDPVAASEGIDPENRMLWRQNRQRLDFEQTRDSLLFAAGQLDLTVGGRAVDIESSQATRRTLYGFIDRQNLPGMFRTFDFASPDATVAQRFYTSVPQQALFMMNSPFVLQQARKVVTRPDVAQAPLPQRIELLYKSILGRAPAADEIELATKFIAAEEAQAKKPPLVVQATPWQYGYGKYDEAAAHVTDFKPFPIFAESMYRGGDKFPDAKLGWAMLNANGGHAGDGFAVVRRWTAPSDGTVSISGKLEHGVAQGDGVRGRVVVKGEGELASYVVHKKQADTSLSGVAVKKGDTIDFVIDRRASTDHDSFGWPVAIKLTAVQTAAGGEPSVAQFDAVTQFAAPPGKPPEGLNAWEKYAQALLETNEFAFVD